MKPRHQVSRAAVDLIKSFEGFRPHAAGLPDGRWTIGYGHTKTARMGAQVTEADAEILLLYDLVEISRAIDDWSFSPLNQNQFDALVSLAFNVGLDSFRQSAVLRQINEGAMLQAACSFDLWRKAEFEGRQIVVDALVRRRAAEKALFLTPVEGWTPAPTPVLPPRCDEEDLASALKAKPVDLRTALVGETVIVTQQDAASLPEAAEPEAPKPETPKPESETPSEPPAPPADAEPDLAPSPATPLSEARPGAVAEPALFEAWSESSERAPFQWLEAPAAQPSEEPAPEPELFQQTFQDGETEGDLSHFEPDYVKPARLTFVWLGALGLAGLAIFAGAIVWGFSAKPSAGLFNPVLVGGVIGVAGIGCIAAVVYSLLAKIGDRND